MCYSSTLALVFKPPSHQRKKWQSLLEAPKASTVMGLSAEEALNNMPSYCAVETFDYGDPRRASERLLSLLKATSWGKYICLDSASNGLYYCCDHNMIRCFFCGFNSHETGLIVAEHFCQPPNDLMRYADIPIVRH
jgi:hypothetical protein